MRLASPPLSEPRGLGGSRSEGEPIPRGSPGLGLQRFEASGQACDRRVVPCLQFRERHLVGHGHPGEPVGAYRAQLRERARLFVSPVQATTTVLLLHLRPPYLAGSWPGAGWRPHALRARSAEGGARKEAASTRPLVSAVRSGQTPGTIPRARNIARV